MSDQQTPLLAEAPDLEPSIDRPSKRRQIYDFWSFLVQNPILPCTFCLQFFFYLAKHVVEVPTVRLIEQAICNRYYAKQDEVPLFSVNGQGVAEQYCKIPAIQTELAAITGLKFTFDALPGLLTALFYGAIADRFGRRLVLALCCAGTLCSYLWILFVCYADLNLPVRLVWLSSVFLCVGGSQRVAKSMNFTVVADSTHATQRTRFMYILAGIPHATTLIAPPVSGVLMNKQIWLPFMVALIALFLGLIILLFMPESLNHHDASGNDDHHHHHQHSPLLGPADALEDSGSENSSPDAARQTTSPDQLPRGMHDRLPAPAPSKREWWRDIITLVQMPGLPFCYVLFFFKPMALIAKAYVYQYASWNFHWKLAQTTWLRFSQAGGSSIATIAVLPLLTSVLLNRRGLRAQTLDLNVIRISFFIAVIGFLLLQFSFYGWMLVLALFVCGLSEGQEPALQGLTTSLIDRAYHARLFTSVAVLEILAKLAGGPMMGRLFAISKADGTGSKGVCFSVSAAILFVLMLLALGMRLKR